MVISVNFSSFLKTRALGPLHSAGVFTYYLVYDAQTTVREVIG